MIGRFSDVGQYRKLFDTGDLIRVFVGGFLALGGYLTQLGGGELFGTALILASVAVNGFPIVKEAIAGLMEKKVNVDELVSIAIIASLLSGEFLSAAVVSFIMVLGALIEEATGESARKAIHDLIEVSPKRAIRVVDGREEEIPVADVKKGDILLVKAGELIPVDAEVTEGGAAVDEASITGEPIPVDKIAGDTVYAGTLCENGLLTVRAERVGEETTLGRVISPCYGGGRAPSRVRFPDRPVCPVVHPLYPLLRGGHPGGHRRTEPCRDRAHRGMPLRVDPGGAHGHRGHHQPCREGGDSHQGREVYRAGLQGKSRAV